MRTAIVTGASRGIGRATAIALGEAGFRVYVTGRTHSLARAPGSIDATAAAVSSVGGEGRAVRVDHNDDSMLTGLFNHVRHQSGTLDLLVNNVFPTDLFDEVPDGPFFEQPVSLAHEMLGAGLRTHYVATWHAARMMARQGSGLVVNIGAVGAVVPSFGPAHAMAKSALDTFTQVAARELKPYGVAMVSVWPGPLVGTERVRRQGADVAAAITETPFLAGRAVAALAADAEVLRLSGRVFAAADLAEYYDFTDADGSRPEYPYDDERMRATMVARLPARPRRLPARLDRTDRIDRTDRTDRIDRPDRTNRAE
jgi:NAD(P)-dependent dehydrogenase (short-subunit alcohol dehydrogenase family)